MTLAEIEALVMQSRAQGLREAEYQTETGLLRLKLMALSASISEEPPAVVRAPCPGVLLLAPAAQRADAAVRPGEIIAFLRIGPCLRAVEVPRPGILRCRAQENSLAGYGEVLFEID